MKKRGLIILIPIALIIAFVFIQAGSVTYGEKIQELIGDREVERIEIRLDDGSTMAVIEDQEIMDKIMEAPSNMNLEETEEMHDPEDDFYVYFHTTGGEFFITVNETVIGRLPGNESGRYEVSNENTLYRNINEIADDA